MDWDGFDASKFAWRTDQKGGQDQGGLKDRANAVELQQDSTDGNTYAEMVASETGRTIYQDLKTIPGTLYKIRLKHASLCKDNVDKMQVVINGTPIEMTRVTANGKAGDKVGEKSTTIATKVTNENRWHHADQWETYEGYYVIPDGQTTTRFGFKAVNYLDPTKGNLLDDVTFARAYKLSYDKNATDANGSVPSDTTEGATKQAKAKTTGTVKTVADEIQAHKDEIGVKGAFSSAGLDSSSAFRYNFHLPSVPLYYEYADDGVDMTKVPSSVKGTYVKKMKNIFDLYIKDSTVEPSSLSGKTMDDSIAEFATGQAVFFQDGVWAYNQIKGQSVSDNDLGVFPIYIGAKGEENQGLNQVISNYWCVNSKVSEKDQQATEKFLSWLVTSDTALKAISQDMGLVSPFKGFDNEKYQVTNPLVGVNREYQKAGKTDVISVPTVSHQWEQNLGSAELNYAQGNGSWDDVVKVFTNDWASEYKLAYGE